MRSSFRAVLAQSMDVGVLLSSISSWIGLYVSVSGFLGYQNCEEGLEQKRKGVVVMILRAHVRTVVAWFEWQNGGRHSSRFGPWGKSNWMPALDHVPAFRKVKLFTAWSVCWEKRRRCSGLKAL